MAVSHEQLEKCYLAIETLRTDVEEDVLAAVQLDRDNLDAEYMRVSADLAFWTKLAADAMEAELAAKVRVDQAKAALKEAEGEAYLRVQERLAGAKPKPTVATLEAYVQTDDAVRGARARLHAEMQEHVRLAADRKRLDGVVSSIYTKREMLISLGAHVRKEMDALNMGT